VELTDYWQTLRRRWKLVLLVLLVAVAVASVLTWRTTPLYASTTRIFIATSESDVGTAYTGSQFATQRATSYANLVESQQLADRVSERLPEVAARDLQDQVQSTVVPETVILEISATDADALLARDLAQAYAEELRTLIEELETPSGRTDAIIKATIVDDAQVSATAVSPQPLRNLGLAVALGLLLGVGLAVARELLDTSIRSAEDVSEVTTAPVIGQVFHDAAAHRGPAALLGRPSPWSEAFRVLRTNMQYVDVDTAQKVVVLTSAVPREGKTTTAVNLATTMAMADQRVALVECDLRRPLVAERLDLDGAVGTTSVLVGKVALDDALQRYGDTDLHVLAAGPIPPNPAELLQSHAMGKLLDDLRERFDAVILDAPPLLPVTDAAVLAGQTDGAVVVVRHGKTGKDQLRHALERLEAVDARALGVVVTMTPARQRTAGYGYGYGYGYGAEGAGSTKRAAREQKLREAEDRRAAKRVARSSREGVRRT
jgi:capsular exopolysaccharide synthesis family protein